MAGVRVNVLCLTPESVSVSSIPQGAVESRRFTGGFQRATSGSMILERGCSFRERRAVGKNVHPNILLVGVVKIFRRNGLKRRVWGSTPCGWSLGLALKSGGRLGQHA